MKKIIIASVISVLLFSCGILSHQTGSRAEQNSYLRSISHLAGEVVIRRTEYGIPHIYADNIKAAGFALGWAQVEDYGVTVAEQLLRARGEWTMYNEIDSDRLEAAIGSDATNRRSYLRAVETWPMLGSDTRDFLEGFAAGVNMYIHRNRKEFEGWVRPFFTGYDVHARSIVTPNSAVVRRFVEIREREREMQTITDASVIEPASDNDTRWVIPIDDDTSEYVPGPEDGSNAWALSPDRTRQGRAILLRNPHLSWTAGYYEAHIVVPGKLNFYGDFRVGYGLGIIGGFNERLGFATTNNAPDLDDIYSFSVDNTDSLAIIVDGESVPVKRETIEVRYKTGKKLAAATRHFYSTPWGPVIYRDNDTLFIIKSAGDGEYRSGEQFLKMMKAQNFEQWEEAMKMRAKVNSNLTYADGDGNIYYVWNATIPVRPHDPVADTVAVHVERAEQMWHDIVPWEELPMLKNPAGGYVRNENDPFHLTNLNEPLPPERFPSYFPEPRLRLRSQHSLELLHNEQRFSLGEIVEMKHSMRMILADRVKDDLITALEDDMPEGEVAEALEMIREWDNSVSVSSRGGLLFETWWDRYVATADSVRVPGSPASVGYAATPEKLFRKPWSYDEPMATPSGLADFDRAVKSFRWAVAETERLYGKWDLLWGEVHRAVRGDVDVPVGGGSGLPGCFRVVNFTRHRSDRMKREANGGDGWIIAVEFTDIPRAYSVLAYGQSNREDSPYYSDQIRNFAENRLTPVAFTYDDVTKQLVREYRPGAPRTPHP